MAAARMDLADSIFHYTNAHSLYGILSSGQLWSTAYHTTNDSSELLYGKGTLTSVLEDSGALKDKADEFSDALDALGLNLQDGIKHFEEHLLFVSHHFVNLYLTSFCSPQSKQDFLDGIISQWRGYAKQGDGYAVEFSIGKLSECISSMGPTGHGYGIHPVFYCRENPTKQRLRDKEEQAVVLFSAYLRRWASLKTVPFFDLSASGKAAMYSTFRRERESGDFLMTYLAYLLSTKHPSFKDESEYRLSAVSSRKGAQHEVACFIRKGMLVPYIATPVGASTNLLKSIQAIVIGPSPSGDSKQRALEHYLSNRRIDHIAIRQSRVPLIQVG